jgi:hypothetical protein
MKTHMTGHVQGIIGTVFKDATDTVRSRLKRMASKVASEMADRTDDVFREVQKDYMTVITGVKLPEGYVVPKAEYQMRAEVAQAVKEAQLVFSGPDVPEPQEEEVSGEAVDDGKASGAQSDSVYESDASDINSERDADEVSQETFVDAEGDFPVADVQGGDDNRNSDY